MAKRQPPKWRTERGNQLANFLKPHGYSHRWDGETLHTYAVYNGKRIDGSEAIWERFMIGEWDNKRWLQDCLAELEKAQETTAIVVSFLSRQVGSISIFGLLTTLPNSR
jgi:hypothetical protein